MEEKEVKRVEEKEVNSLAIISKNNQINLNVLTEEQKKNYLENVNEFDGKNIDSIVQFGSNISKAISQNSSMFFDYCKDDTSGEVGKLLNELLVNLESVNPQEIKGLSKKWITKLSLTPIFGRFFKNLNKTIQKYDGISKNVEKISNQIIAGKMKLMGDNNILQVMYDNDKKTISELEDMIIGGKLQLEILKNRLEHMKANSDQYQDYEIYNLEEYINIFDKKVTDWLVARCVLQNGLTEKRSIQLGNVKLMNNSESISTVTIPVWKSGLAQAIALNRQKRVLKSHQAISKHTNDLIQKNSENLRTQMKEISEETQKSVVSLETLEKSTNNIIQMLVETAQANEDGRQKRRELEAKLLELNNNMVSIASSSENITKISYNMYDVD
jgi:uncharacterized protein YaaN involved in tellurite resistance